MNKAKKVLIRLLESFIKYCNSIVDKLKSKVENSPKRTFEDLTPKSDLDKFDEYMEALEWALQNKKVKNIALTGPYGSGKSSILLSFFKKHRTDYESFNISLASFNKEDMSEQQLEESILKQLFYSAKPKKLPESGLKRVYSKDKRRTFLHSSLFVIWLISSLTIISDTVHKNFQDWLGSSIIPFTVVSIFICFLGLLVITFVLFQKARRVNLSKLNLTSAEFELAKESDSTFSKHLDEIIYFFECEKYDVVVFEDIDRFESKRIFTKLRELNTLLNQSAQIDRSIRFIYAVKDELFDEDKLRTIF